MGWLFARQLTDQSFSSAACLSIYGGKLVTAGHPVSGIKGASETSAKCHRRTYGNQIRNCAKL